MTTFFPGDIFRLGLLIAVVCVAGLLAGYAARRWLRPNAAKFDWSTAGWMWVGFWAFGMLMTLVADLTTAAGAPFWLKTVMFALMAIMAVGIAQAERRFHRRLAAVPSEPIHQVQGSGSNSA